MSWSITKRLLKTLIREHTHWQRTPHCGTCLLIDEAASFCAVEEELKQAKKVDDYAGERSLSRRLGMLKR